MATILVIEDDPGLREATVDLLELAGYAVLSAPDGVAGVALARHHLPALIVCDIGLPYLDGYGVVTTLRQQSATATIPVLFLTARASAADQRQGLTAGAAEYLTKPFSFGALVAAIQRCLAGAA
jgi:DNA-binding response OmpR family regulator